MREIYKSITKGEKKLLIVLAVFLIFITTTPYIFGYFNAPENSFYTGVHALTPGDTSVYYSYIEQAKQGDFLFKDLYTSEDQETKLIKPFWYGVGIFAKAFQLPSWIAVQIVRIVCVLLRAR